MLLVLGWGFLKWILAAVVALAAAFYYWWP